MTDSKGTTQRLVFTDMVLTDREQKEWGAFFEYCKEQNLEVPESYVQRDKMALRYLQACKWNYERTHSAITTHYAFVQNEKPEVYP